MVVVVVVDVNCLLLTRFIRIRLHANNKEMGDTIVLLLCLVRLIVSLWIFLFVSVYSVHETDMHAKCKKKFPQEEKHLLAMEHFLC